MQETPADKPKRKPQDNARYFKTILARSGTNLSRAIKVACYNPRRTGGDPTVVLGIGPDAAEFSKMTVVITPELWDHIDRSVREALHAAL